MIQFNNIKPEDTEMVWNWVNQFPEFTMDDYGPKTLEQFIKFTWDQISYEPIIIVSWDSIPFAAVKVTPVSDRVAVCDVTVDKKAHGSYKIHIGIRKFLDILWEEGYEKIMAFPLEHNNRIAKIAKALGATEEGLLKKQTIQDGKPVDTRILSFFKENS